MSGGWVYVMASRKNGVLYAGVTSDLVKRVGEHREGTRGRFTSRYRVHRLIWFERHERIEEAIQRESNIKHWPRAWKVRLIARDNPDWLDLYETLF